MARRDSVGVYEAQELGGWNQPGKAADSSSVVLPRGVAGTQSYYAPEPAPLDPDRARDEAEVSEEVRETWLRGAMDAMQAGREIPVREIPRDLGDTAILSEEATSDLYRRAATRRFSVNIDIKMLERRKRERLEQEREAARWLARVIQHMPAFNVRNVRGEYGE